MQRLRRYEQNPYVDEDMINEGLDIKYLNKYEKYPLNEVADPE